MGGIHQYTLCLAEALRAESGVDVDVLFPRSGRCPSRRGAARAPAGYDALLVQYNPFAYGRRGVAPQLPLHVARFRREARARIALMVHEPYVPADSVRTGLMHGWQRLQLTALMFAADVIFASMERWVRELAAQWPKRATFHLPVGSNLPDMRAARERQRERLEIDGHVVLTTFGSGHPSRRLDFVAAAANSVAETGKPVVLFNLGLGSPPVIGVDRRVRVYEPGRLHVDDLARTVAATDVYLAPLVDGASTRRTTLAAALQHGLPIVATDGASTGRTLRDSAAMRLVPIDDREAFVQEVGRLVADDEQRVRLGQAARRFFDQRLDWPILARSVLQRLGGGGAPPPDEFEST